MVGSVYWDMTVELENSEFAKLLNMFVLLNEIWMQNRYTTEFVTILNKCDCCNRWECKTRSDNLICYIIKFVDYEWDMSVKLEKTSEFANCWINGTVDIR